MTKFDPIFDVCSVCTEHQLLQLIFDATDAAIFRLDNYGRITLVNQRMIDMFKITREQLIGHFYDDILGTNNKDDNFTQLKPLIDKTINSINFQRVYVRSDDSQFNGQFRARGMFDKNNQPEGVVVIISDITEQKTVENELLHCRTRFSVMTDNLPCGLYDLAQYPDGRSEYSYLSSRAEEIYELTFAELQADMSLFWNMVFPEDLHQLLNLNKECNKKGNLFEAKFRIKTRSGKIKWIKTSSSPNPHLAGEHVIWSGYIIDITRQKSMEQDLLELEIAHRVSLEHERIMEDLHDGFGSQLSSAGLLAQRGELTNAQMATLLQECMEDLHIVVDTFSNQERNLHTSLVNFRHRLQQRNNHNTTQFNWDFQLDQIPAMDSRTILHVLRIIQEVINNALKHAQAKQINISATYANDTLVVTISDNGIGMPEEFRAGRGLKNINKRAHEIGGYLHFERKTPGTEVSLIVVINR
ncbi:MAG: PAS domain S-box protein [Methylococcales bacterium]|nr:PAS domain S-box protein [Methylococcales bacterium]